MKFTFNNWGRIALALALGVGVASAQDTGLDSRLKVRTGLELSSNPDHLANRIFGFGVDLGYTFSFGRISAELGYQYKPGNQYMNDMSSVVPVSSDVVIQAPTGTESRFGSVDSRKNKLEGVTGRFAFETMPILGSPFSAQIGVQVGGAKFTHEVLGQTYGGYASIPDGSVDFLDTYYGTPKKSTLAISPFVGVSYLIDKNSSLELNLISVSYKSINYIHVAGTVPADTSISQYGNNVSLDYLTEKSRNRLHLEVAYAFHF